VQARLEERALEVGRDGELDAAAVHAAEERVDAERDRRVEQGVEERAQRVRGGGAPETGAEVKDPGDRTERQTRDGSMHGGRGDHRAASRECVHHPPRRLERQRVEDGEQRPQERHPHAPVDELHRQIVAVNDVEARVPRVVGERADRRQREEKPETDDEQPLRPREAPRDRREWRPRGRGGVLRAPPEGLENPLHGTSMRLVGRPEQSAHAAEWAAAGASGSVK
jgi:hypothetical protein